MGVSGCGKSSVAQLLAASLGWTLHEGDAYHAPESVRKMQSGIALTDDDREHWLQQLAQLLAQAKPAAGVVLTCSALKRKYRDRLREALPNAAVGFVFLDLGFATALERVRQRPGHFFSPDLVANQFATLERPDAEAGVVGVDATLPLAEIVRRVDAWRTGCGTPQA
ncbi:gluconokinase [Comamonas endophytica]|uniref:Gluconokinase n=1 Tax=Comamonas endophytica TaxID=2949090 RepID=A0ABY6GGW2_9BURK|nr:MULTISPECIES: gluconokinase [unclassified Acidovorax]MCD2514430.1 gluconokinase [Acidovorax sp. D4N7]UYG53719.1 gluconokinase [Acidovorax sp. 5MLIR]